MELSETGGYPPVLNLAHEIANKLRSERDLLFEFATATLDAVDALGNTEEAETLLDAICTSLDAYRSFDIDVVGYLPEDVFRFIEKR